MDREFVHEHQVLIAVAAACWREREPSQSWHVFEWMCDRLRRKYPLARKSDQIINFDVTS